jgi:hypothetical protein
MTTTATDTAETAVGFGIEARLLRRTAGGRE